MSVCGPNVTPAIADVWQRIQINFGSWGFQQKASACLMLVQPIVYQPRSPIQLTPEAIQELRRLGRPAQETSHPGLRGLLTPSNYRLNRDAWDTIGLFRNSMGYLSRDPIRGSCCIPTGVNSLDENPQTCSCSVQVGSECWLSGTVNYGAYGMMMKLCYDFTSLPIFSRTAMQQLVRIYKRGQEDAEIPLSWAVATWDNGPSGVPSRRGNRPNCQTTCRFTATGGFEYVWEPVMPRSRRNFSTFSPIMVRRP